MNTNFYTFTNQKTLIEDFSKTIIDKLEKAIEKKGEAVLLVSGGNTPKPLFEKLRTFDISWNKVKIGLVDERWLDGKHEDSNAKLVKEYLLKDKASKALFIPLYQENLDPLKSIDIC